MEIVTSLQIEDRIESELSTILGEYISHSAAKVATGTKKKVLAKMEEGICPLS